MSRPASYCIAAKYCVAASIYCIAISSPAFAAPAVPPVLPPPAAWRAPAPLSSTTPAGMAIAVLPSHDLPLVSVLVTVRAGAALDAPGRPGLAAAVASMLQDGGAGTRSAPELSRALEALGDTPLIECDRDGVRLGLTVQSRYLDQALSLLADLVARPRFDGDEWTRARARRVAEIAHQRDQPNKVADAVFDRALFGDAHPYGAPLLGTEAALSSFTAADLVAFHRAHYGPRTTAVALVGDVDPKTAAARVAAAFSSFDSAAVPAPPPVAAPRPPATHSARGAARLVLVDRPGATQSELRMGHLGLARATADYAPMSLLETALGGSFTSRLVQNLRERHGYTYGVRARFLLDEAPGPFIVASAVRSDATAPAAEEIAKELRAAAGSTPISADEIKKARALVENGLLESFSSRSETALLLGDLQVHRLPLDTFTELPAALERVTADNLSPVAARLLLTDALELVVVGDLKTIEPPLRALPFVISVEHRDAEGRVLPAR